MAKEFSETKIGYVLFSRVIPSSEDNEEVILFVGEFDDVADAEQRKAEINRTMPRNLAGTYATVGLAYFFAHEDDEDKDFIRIMPKDNSSYFAWGDMTDIKDVLEVAEAMGK